jgi:isoleucyl-tRNA synthetase
VLDHLHRCLTTWLAPVLCFTAEEAWRARFGEDASVHLQTFPDLPAAWRDPALAVKWELVRAIRRGATTEIEAMRKSGRIGASLQASVTLRFATGESPLLSAEEWAEVLIVSDVAIQSAGGGGEPGSAVGIAEGTKCARCWRVLPEVGRQAGHPALCARCADAVESGLVCRAAAE